VGGGPHASATAGLRGAWTADKVEEAEEVLHWHAANLEFALGAPLECVSAEWWNFDDACAYAGPHWVLPGGYASLLAPLQVCC
jgi:lysine-specific histone demethylase 1